MTTRRHLRIDSVRPLVRYVDESQAVVELHIGLLAPLPINGEPDTRPIRTADLLIQVNMPDGFIDEHPATAEVHNLEATVRFTIVEPLRWWPAGMGDQALYELSVHLVANNEPYDSHSTTLGLTSIRQPTTTQTEPRRARRRRGAEFVVNGMPFGVNAVMPIDAIHENRLLPATGGMLLLVRGHYGPDVLYNAADRAGLLMLQCIPIDPHGRPDAGIAQHVDRLANHPSLVGWVVGHLGQLAGQTASTLHSLDPTRKVFLHAPGQA